MRKNNLCLNVDDNKLSIILVLVDMDSIKNKMILLHGIKLIHLYYIVRKFLN